MVLPTINKESVEIKLIKNICRNSFASNNRLDLATQWQRLNWPKFLELANKNEVATLVYSQLRKLSLDKKMPSEIQDKFKITYYGNIRRNLLFCREYIRIDKLLEKQAIAHAPIKGMGLLLTIYQDIALRSMCDLDLLVRNEDFPRMQEVMFKEGYRLNPPDNLMNKKMLFSGRGIFLEVHDDLYSSYARSIHFAQSWQRLQQRQIEEKAVKVPSREDLFLSVILHYHFFYQNLKSSVDVMHILYPNINQIDWDYITHSLRKAGLLSLLWYKLNLAFAAFNLTLPEAIMAKIKGRGYRYKSKIFNRIIKQEQGMAEVAPTNRRRIESAWFNFLLFDSWWRWLEYFMNKCVRYLTIRRFAEFCSLRYSSFFTRLCYRLRIIVIPLRILFLMAGKRTSKRHNGQLEPCAAEKEVCLSNQDLCGLIRATLAQGAEFRFQARGFSMFPFIREADLISIAAADNNSLKLGQVVAFISPRTGQLVVHRIIGKVNNTYLVKGDNASDPDGLISAENILGWVSKIKRNDRRVYLGLGCTGIPIALLSRIRLFFVLSYLGRRLPVSCRRGLKRILLANSSDNR